MAITLHITADAGILWLVVAYVIYACARAFMTAFIAGVRDAFEKAHKERAA